MTKRRPLSERFWERVDVRGPDECWPWLGSKDKAGYGLINAGGDEWHRTRRVSRVCWTLCFGPIPEGMDVLHSCDFPPCCNPRCFFLGTDKDNAQDRAQKGRSVTPDNSGEKHGLAKLTAIQVDEIRRAPGRYREIAARFGIGRGHVSQIKTGKRWASTQQEKNQ